MRNGLNWCKANYVHSRAMCRAADVRDQVCVCVCVYLRARVCVCVCVCV